MTNKFYLKDKVMIKNETHHPQLIGKPLIIVAITTTTLDDIVLYDVETEDGSNFAFSECDLTRYTPDIRKNKYELHINSDGKTTSCVYKEDGELQRKVFTRLHPDDEFNFITGVENCVNRMFDLEEKYQEEECITETSEESKPSFRVGDKVCIVDSGEIYDTYINFFFDNNLPEEWMCRYAFGDKGSYDSRIGEILYIEEFTRGNYDRIYNICAIAVGEKVVLINTMGIEKR